MNLVIDFRSLPNLYLADMANDVSFIKIDAYGIELRFLTAKEGKYSAYKDYRDVNGTYIFPWDIILDICQ